MFKIKNIEFDTDYFIKRLVSMTYIIDNYKKKWSEEVEDDGVPFEEKVTELTGKLYAQMKESVKLDEVIKKNLEELGYGE